MKPRGLFDQKYLRHFDKSAQGGWSEVVNVYVNKGGGLGYPNTTDALPAHKFAALLRHIEQLIAQTADRIIAGQIDVRPYRLGKTPPAATANFVMSAD